MAIPDDTSSDLGYGRSPSPAPPAPPAAPATPVATSPWLGVGNIQTKEQRYAEIQRAAEAAYSAQVIVDRLQAQLERDYVWNSRTGQWVQRGSVSSASPEDILSGGSAIPTGSDTGIPVVGDPRIQELADASQRLADAKAYHTWINNLEGLPSASSLGGGGGGGSSAPADPLKAYLNSGTVLLEEMRSDEADKRYKDAATRAKDYASLLDAHNELIKDKASMQRLGQQMSDDASKIAASVNEDVRAGRLDYYDGLYGPAYSNPLQIYQDMLKQLPEGMDEMFLHGIPKQVMPDYRLDDVIMMPDSWGEDIPRWEEGTIPRYADGTVDWRDEPYLALYAAGARIPTDVRLRLEASGAIGGTTQPTTGNNAGVQRPPDTTGYKPGDIPYNATVDAPHRLYDYNEWRDQAVDAMARNVSEGRAALPPEWGDFGLESWIGVPAAYIPQSVKVLMGSIVDKFKDTPEIRDAFGDAPDLQTTYVPGKGSTAPKATTSSSGGGGGGISLASLLGGRAPSMSGGGVEDDGLTAYQQAQIDLENRRLGLDSRRVDYEGERVDISWEELAIAQQRAAWQKELEQAQLVLSQNQDKRSAEYQAAQLKAMEAEQQINQADLLLRQAANEREDAKFEYQKERDKAAQDLERGKITAEMMANPNDPFAAQFWYAGMATPEGEAIDAFTGESRGQKNWDQAWTEDAELWDETVRKPVLLGKGTGSMFRHDRIAVLGDKGETAKGTEETLVNPTGAPVAVLNNKQSVAAGVVPRRGRPYGKHLRKG